MRVLSLPRALLRYLYRLRVALNTVRAGILSLCLCRRIGNITAGKYTIETGSHLLIYEKGMIGVATIEETKANLERESVIVSERDVSAAMLVALAKGMFDSGRSEVELVVKVGSVQIGYIELYDAGGATSFAEVSDSIKLNLAKLEYSIDQGIIAESVTLQASNPGARGGLYAWVNTESDYFDLKDEQHKSATEQLDALIAATRSIAAATDEHDRLEFLMRPTELHSAFLKALMEAKGLKLERTETKH